MKCAYNHTHTHIYIYIHTWNATICNGWCGGFSPEALAVLRDLWAEPLGDGAEIRG